MAVLDEANIQTTIIAFKARAAMYKEMPVRVQLVVDDELASARAWRSCAIEYLEGAERTKQKEETLVVD
jgi:hypothetical protein